jgi:putative ATPase
MSMDEDAEQGDLFAGTEYAEHPARSGPVFSEPRPGEPWSIPRPGRASKPSARKTSPPAPRRKPAEPLADAGRRAPLAERMRPTRVDEMVGTEAVLGDGTLLRRLIDQKQPLSLIFWGPPGSGKTTLARILMDLWGLPSRFISAVTSGIADARAVFAEAQKTLRENGRPTVVFVDEIHRFNKSQQDAFLPYVENGTIVMLGATTENPSFSVISPLLSRCRVLVLEPLSAEQLRHLIERALADRKRGLGELEATVDDGAVEALLWGSGGDARRALNTLEVAVLGTAPDRVGQRHVGEDDVRQALGRRMQQYERGGESAFNILSAFHKSLRGSDPDAAVYWLVRLIEAGEDPLVAARRMIAMAAEDVGLADPRALQIAVAAFQAYQVMGSPEGDLALTEAAIFLASAPKSNAAATALWEARDAVERHGSLAVPLHLRNAATGLLKRLGYGEGYKYAHDFPGAQAEQQHLPDELAGTRFFRPSERGFEGQLRRRDGGGTAD